MSFPKVLAVMSLVMLAFVGGCYAIGIPLADPGLRAFVVVLVVLSTPTFATLTCLSLRCHIGREGIRWGIPVLHERFLPWSEVTATRSMHSNLMHVVQGRNAFDIVVLPRRWLLKDPDSLKRLIETYAPADSIVRRALAA